MKENKMPSYNKVFYKNTIHKLNSLNSIQFVKERRSKKLYNYTNMSTFIVFHLYLLEEFL